MYTYTYKYEALDSFSFAISFNSKVWHYFLYILQAELLNSLLFWISINCIFSFVVNFCAISLTRVTSFYLEVEYTIWYYFWLNRSNHKHSNKLCPMELNRIKLRICQDLQISLLFSRRNLYFDQTIIFVNSISLSQVCHNCKKKPREETE